MAAYFQENSMLRDTAKEEINDYIVHSHLCFNFSILRGIRYSDLHTV